jgi:hypothetical protein
VRLPLPEDMVLLLDDLIGCELVVSNMLVLSRSLGIDKVLGYNVDIAYDPCSYAAFEASRGIDLTLGGARLGSHCPSRSGG